MRHPEIALTTTTLDDVITNEWLLGANLEKWLSTAISLERSTLEMQK